jgi:hypothetical protein
MCWNGSQILLIVVGSIFEFLSLAMSAKTIFWDDIKEFFKKSKYKVTKEIKPRDVKIAIVLLIIGIILQRLAVFV